MIFPHIFSRKRLFPALLLVLLAGYAFVLVTYFVPVTGGTDQNGYHVESWMLASQGRFSQRPADDFEFVGRMWVVNADGLYYPKYPPLYPLLAGTVIRLTGQASAGFWLSPVCAWLTVLGMYVLGTVFLPRGWAFLAAVFMTATPVFLFYGLNKASHAPSMAFLTWGMAAFFIAASKRRLSAAWFPAMAGGFLIGYAVGIRYTNILLLAPPLVYWLLFRSRRRWWMPLMFLAGAAVPCLFLAAFHQYAFGAPWRTGYALTGEQGGFSLSYFLPNLRLYCTGMLDHASGPVTLFSMIGLALLFLRRPRRALFFCSWLLPLFLLYTCYYWAPTTSFAGTLRFIMPLLAPLYLLALFGVRELLRPLPRKHRVFCVLTVLAVQSMWGGYQELIEGEKRWIGDRLIFKTLAFAHDQIPKGSAIFAETKVLNNLDFGKRWHLYPTEIFDPAQIKKMAARTENVDVSPLQPQRVEKWNELLVDVPQGTYIKRIQRLVDAQISQGRKVYLFGSKKRIYTYRNRLRRYFKIEPVSELSGEISAYQWMNPAKQSMRNVKQNREKPIPPQILLEITATRKVPLAPDVPIKELIRQRREQLRKLSRDYPEIRHRLQMIQRLDQRIQNIP